MPNEICKSGIGLSLHMNTLHKLFRWGNEEVRGIFSVKAHLYKLKGPSEAKAPFLSFTDAQTRRHR